MSPSARNVVRRRPTNNLLDDEEFVGPSFFGKRLVKDITENMTKMSLADIVRHKIYYNKMKAPAKMIHDEDRLDDPESGQPRPPIQIFVPGA